MKYSQYSRVAHHAISEGEFTIPASEDFTDGTWISSDLVDREIGIISNDKRIFVRIGDEVKEFQLVGGDSSNEFSFDIIDEDVFVKRWETIKTLHLNMTVVGYDDEMFYSCEYSNLFYNNGSDSVHYASPTLIEYSNTTKRTPFLVIPSTDGIEIKFIASVVPNSTWKVKIQYLQK